MDVKVNSRGQITIPLELRKNYGIAAGTKIVFIDEGEHIRLQPLTPSTFTACAENIEARNW
jgi:AbrB family looped-hinge helix DNA binding protein